MEGGEGDDGERVRYKEREGEIEREREGCFGFFMVFVCWRVCGEAI